MPLPPSSAWHILGAGASGSLWGARMARSGTPVSIITRLDATGFAQIRVLDKFADAGTNALPSWRARVTLDSGTETPISRLLVATKAKDVASGVSSLRSRLVSGAAVVLLGNGLLGARDQLWARAADEGWEEFNLFLGGSTHGSYLRASDDPADFRSVVHAGLGSAWLGPDTRGPATSVDAKRIAEELEAGELGIKNVPSNEVQIRLWRKLAVNAAINAVTALVDCPNGQLLDSPSGKRIASAVVNEVALLASATLGQHPLLLADDIAAHVFKVAHTTRRNLSSMCIDIRLGRASEIEYINGYVASAAKQMGLPTPVNDALAELVRMKEESMVKGGEC